MDRNYTVRQIGGIEATWTQAARAEIARFLVQTGGLGAVLSLTKTMDDAAGRRWSYTALTPERARTLDAALASRGHRLLYSIEGFSVAISNANHARELDGTEIDLGDSGYLIARPR